MELIEIFALALIFIMIGIIAFFIITVSKHIDSENKKTVINKKIMEEKLLEKKEIMENKELVLNPKAIWAFGLSIVGILGLYLLSFIAVIVGILSIKEINKNQHKYKGIGFAIAGLIIGILGALANIGQYLLN